MNSIPAFTIKLNDKLLDYRIGTPLNINEVENYFSKKFVVEKIWNNGRHVLGILQKNKKKYFLKLATTEGISALTKIEYQWNKEVYPQLSQNNIFNVPQAYDCGLYNGLFFLLTEYIEAHQLATGPNDKDFSFSTTSINKIIKFSEILQTLTLSPISFNDTNNHMNYFRDKTKQWYNAIPKKILGQYSVDLLLKICFDKNIFLEAKTRHGDFTPWHIMEKEEKLILLDGEHAMKNGVEYYDICYLIQRIYSELRKPSLANKIVNLLLERNYDKKKLQTVLAARAIGGFLDESLKSRPDYEMSKKFSDMIKNL